MTTAVHLNFVILGETGSDFNCRDDISLLGGLYYIFWLCHQAGIAQDLFHSRVHSFAHSFIQSCDKQLLSPYWKVFGQIGEYKGGFIGLHTPVGAVWSGVYHNGLKCWLQP